VELRKRQDEMKKLVPPFFFYDFSKSNLEIKREHIITIYDPTTGITVTRRKPAESEPWRIMTHRAKMELIRWNKQAKEFESREENDETSIKNENKISVKSESTL